MQAKEEAKEEDEEKKEGEEEKEEGEEKKEEGEEKKEGEEEKEESEKKKEGEEEGDDKKEKKKKKRTSRVALNVTVVAQTMPALTEESQVASIGMLRALHLKDVEKAGAAEAKNTLESYIISTRSKVGVDAPAPLHSSRSGARFARSGAELARSGAELAEFAKCPRSSSQTSPVGPRDSSRDWNTRRLEQQGECRCRERGNAGGSASWRAED
eukprot:598475-Prorocentrum_minimum.AAC.4